MKKYEFTKETINVFRKTLHRIRAARDFSNVRAGDFGGFIESESNLSHDDDAWVYGNAQVYGNARVSGNAQVYGNAWVCGNARVSGNAQVYDDAQVSGDAQVYGNARVRGNAQVSGDAWVCGDAQVSGDARVCESRDIYWISCIGSRNDTTTFVRNANDSKIGRAHV